MKRSPNQTGKIKTRFQTVLLLAFILATILAGSVGSLFTIPAIPQWYVFLNKPWFSPPNWVFGPVWTTLYALMGTSFYLVYRQGISRQPVRDAVMIYLIQFFFNVIWSFLFFGLRSPALGLACIFVLWMTIVATVKVFYKIDKTAAYLLVPYLLWVSFAAILNSQVYLLN